MSNTARPFIFPTYQSRLNHILGYVEQSFHMGDMESAWNDLRILYYASPDEVQDDVRAKFQEIEKKLDGMSCEKQVDVIQSSLAMTRQREQFLIKSAYGFYDLVHRSLFKRGYLEKKSRPTQSNTGEYTEQEVMKIFG